MYHGDIRLGETVDIKFTTTAAATGAPTTLAGTPVISAYPGNSTTQLTSGITLTVDFDGVTGLHNVRVVATSGNSYATATNYTLVITTGTVGGTSAVGYCIGSFSIEARSALMPTTVARTLDVSAGGEAGVDWANVGSPTTAVNLSATNIDVDQVVASVSGAVGSVTAGVTVTTNNDKTGYGLSAAAVQAIWDALTTALTAAGSIGKKLADWTIGTAQTGDSFARLGAPAGASVSADIAAVKVDTAAILVDTGTTLDANITSIKAKTDSLAFTVAGHVDSNVQYVNDVAVTGTGTAGDPWGP